MKLAEFSEQLRTHAYSRVPVYRSNLDEVVGIAFMHDLLHISDIEAASVTVSSIARPAMFTPETKNIQSLLREMQRSNIRMAIVVDEYGGVAGLVTIEANGAWKAGHEAQKASISIDCGGHFEAATGIIERRTQECFGIE